MHISIVYTHLSANVLVTCVHEEFLFFIFYFKEFIVQLPLQHSDDE